MDGGAHPAERGHQSVFANPGSVAAARLTGCKNIAPAVRAGAYAVDVPNWGVHLTTARPVPDGLRAVGPARPRIPSGRTRQPLCRVLTDAVEEAVRVDLSVPLRGTGRGRAPALVAHAKGQKPAVPPEALGIAPENILLLT